MTRVRSQEKVVETWSGWGILLAVLAALPLLGWLLYLFIQSAIAAERTSGVPNFWLLAGFVIGVIAWLTTLGGFFTLQPNEARALILFGNYVGTERRSGFHWTNPFNSKTRVSLRARNFNTPKLKVNDKRGNPIEIGAVVVWRVADTAEALFDVDNYEEFVSVQSESAVRMLASKFAYDDGEEGEVTLRSGADEIAHSLTEELQSRLATAGVVIDETRLIQLAYAPEIAQAMLRRQQAEAIIAARHKIVHGAVSMVEMALHDLADRNIVDLDTERKAQMVSNLLVVLCSETETQPVVNAGSIH